MIIPKYIDEIEEFLGISEERYIELSDELYIDMLDAVNRHPKEEDVLLLTSLIPKAVRNCKNDREAVMIIVLFPKVLNNIMMMGGEKGNNKFHRRSIEWT